MNKKLKGALVARFGTQTAAAKAAKMSESRLSRIVHGWSEGTPDELKNLKRILGERRMKKVLPKEAPERTKSNKN
jgi:hypothetical protein